MEGLAEHEILAGTYEAYLLAYRIGDYELSYILLHQCFSCLLVNGFSSYPRKSIF